MVMRVAPRTGVRAVAKARGEHEHPSQDWTRWCQRFVRTDFDLPLGFPTAIAQFRGTPANLRHRDKAPPYGVAGFFSAPRVGAAGHAVLVGKRRGLWSNDIDRAGRIDFTSIAEIEGKWGYRWEGWTETVNGFRIWGHGPAISAHSVEVAQRGDREHPHGERVKRELEKVVGRHGMNVRTDHLGGPTRAAVKELQFRLGLRRTGIVGPRLLGWLADQDHAFTAAP